MKRLELLIALQLFQGLCKGLHGVPAKPPSSPRRFSAGRGGSSGSRWRHALPAWGRPVANSRVPAGAGYAPSCASQFKPGPKSCYCLRPFRTLLAAHMLFQAHPSATSARLQLQLARRQLAQRRRPRRRRHACQARAAGLCRERHHRRNDRDSMGSKSGSSSRRLALGAGRKAAARWGGAALQRCSPRGGRRSPAGAGDGAVLRLTPCGQRPRQHFGGRLGEGDLTGSAGVVISSRGKWPDLDQLGVVQPSIDAVTATVLLGSLQRVLSLLAPRASDRV